MFLPRSRLGLVFGTALSALGVADDSPKIDMMDDPKPKSPKPIKFGSHTDRARAEAKKAAAEEKRARRRERDLAHFKKA